MKKTQHLKINAADSKLLAAIQQRGSLSFSDIARLTKSKEHAVRYRFHALRRRGVILERVPFVDMYRLGYTVFKIYADIAPDKQALQQNLIDYLIKSPQVAWIAQVGGAYQFVFSVCIRKLSEINQFLEQLTASVGTVFNHSDLVIQLQFTAFGRKYLAPTLKSGPILSFGQNAEDPIALDQLDHRILSAISQGDLSSERQISEQLTIPLTTVRRRLSNLEKHKVLVGFVYRYNLALIGLNRFSMLVSVRGLSSLVSKKMHTFCSQHPRIVNLGECLGSWQFEITAEVESPADTVAIIREIGETFGSEVSQIITLPVFRSFKYSSYSVAI